MTRKSRGTRAESGITPQRHAQSIREHAQKKDHVPKYHVQPKCFCVLADHSAKTTERWQTRDESGPPPLPETQCSLKTGCYPPATLAVEEEPLFFWLGLPFGTRPFVCAGQISDWRAPCPSFLGSKVFGFLAGDTRPMTRAGSR